MRWVVLLSFALVSVVFAGCVDDSKEDVAPESTDDPSGAFKDTTVSGKDLGYEVDASQANESMLAGAHTHDMWGSTTSMVLFDKSVETADCNTFTKAVSGFIAGVQEQRAQYGCAWIFFDDGVIVHEGTESLLIEIDVTEAKKAGEVTIWYGNAKKDRTALDACAGTTCSWTIPVDPIEWDIPHTETSAWGFGIEPRGQVGVLDGAIDVYVEAKRQADWVPILGSAHIDHWAPGAAHDFLTADRSIMRVMDVNVSITQESAQGRSGEWDYPIVEMTDIIAPGAKQVTVVYMWDEVAGCPQTDKCWVEGWFKPISSGARYAGQLVERGTLHAIYKLDVGDRLQADSTYATASQYRVQVHLQSCLNGEQQQIGKGMDTCNGEVVAELSANLRIEVEAWQKNADIQRLKQRLGI